jgi:exodeoxyribonuclease V gamma subunit
MHELIEEADAGGYPEALSRVAQAEGWLPSGAWGELLADNAALWHANLRQRAEPITQPVLPPLPWQLAGPGWRLYGEWQALSPQGLGVCVFNKPRAADCIQLWLEHLALCAVQPAGVACQSHLFSLDKDFCYPLLSPAQAQSYLQDWVNAWQSLAQRPLPLPPRAAHAAAEALAKSARKQGLQPEPDGRFVPAQFSREALDQALETALTFWNGGDSGYGPMPEGQQAWHQLLWSETTPIDTAFLQAVCQLWLPMHWHREVLK